MKLCWLIPDDRSGGVRTVAQACCQEAAQNGHEVTLLAVLPLTQRLTDLSHVQITSLGLSEPALETPITLINWLRHNPQDVLFLNGCEQADTAIAYLPNDLYCVYVVHDTAPRYWNTTIQAEHHLDRIVAVSETVAQQFRHRLQNPHKLVTILNGCHFPPVPTQARQDDLVFLGGDQPMKGAFDMLAVWRQLHKQGFTGCLHWYGHLSASFQTTIQRLPDSSRIYRYGQASRADIFATAVRSRVLLMLSRVEPFGMATIEAMSMGCVPIAWEIESGTKEIIGSSQTGVFVPLGNIEHVAQEVMTVCQHHPALEQAAIAHARTFFNAAVMGNQYETLIQEMTAQPAVHRTQTGQQPPLYHPPVRKFQVLPGFIRAKIREFVGRSPQLGYWLRDMRGL
jgi:glycosyltransferase involved in cell wall biosynthesis